jgi:tetratricopeptide (TPR) repeat protein/S1-C subfamily serine protease
MKTPLLTAVFLPTSLLVAIAPAQTSTLPTNPRLAQAALDDGLLTPQQVKATAKNISVRVTAENNGGSGVIIAKKRDNYLILTNAHILKRSTNIEIIAPDGQKYQAKPIDGGFDAKYDLALLQFSSKRKYSLANLKDIGGSPIEPERTIYSAGFPFDSKDLRITSGQISQLSDIPFDDGTQIGYTTNKGEKGIRQGMSGGAIFDAQGNFLGINTVSVAPILPNYTYNDGSKPIPKLKAAYARANWGIPVYNFLTHVKPDLLYGYDNLRQTKVEHQVKPTGYLAKLNIKARQMTVRIENSGGSGSGVIVAREGKTYYVLTAKHVLQDEENNTHQKFTNHQLITYDQDRRNATSTIVAEGVDLAVVKFTSNNNYPIAQLGEYEQNNYDIVFVGGFPGRLNIKSPLWQWQLNPGFVYERELGKLSTQSNQSFANGYDLLYSSISYAGMSGGPVFDTAGNVIGIHGRAESTDIKSLGISSQTFTGLLNKLHVNLNLLKVVKTSPVELNSVERKNVISAMQNIPQPQQGEDGARWLAYGNQLYRTGQYDKSVVAFEFAIAKNQKLLGNYGKALSLRNTGKYRLAESAIAQAITVVPPNERAQYYYLWGYQSVIFQASGKYDEALKAIDLAIGLERSDLRLLNLKAMILEDKKQYAQAVVIYDELIRKQPQAYAYNNRGTAKSELGNEQEAILDYDRAIALNPKFALAYYGRGTAKSALGNKQEAILDYDRAISLNPKDAKAYNNRGNAKSALGNKQEAIADFDRAISLNPKHALAYNNRGTTKSALGNKQEAIVDYDRAISLNPKDAKVYNNRGNAKSALGNKQEAIADFDRAIALNPRLPQPYDSRGTTKSEMGNKQEAIVDYDRAIALDPKYAVAYYGRGNAKSDLGNKQGAIADLSKAAELSRQQGRMDLYQKAMGLLKQLQGS